jgi:hypothetical protein
MTNRPFGGQCTLSINQWAGGPSPLSGRNELTIDHNSEDADRIKDWMVQKSTIQ